MKCKAIFLAGVMLLACMGRARATDRVFFAGPVPAAPDVLFYSGLHTPEFFTDTVFVEIRAEDLAPAGMPRGLLIHSEFVREIGGLVYSVWSGGEMLTTFGPGGSWLQALGVGEYAVKISGQANGLDGGSYGLSLQLAPLPAPEPSPWALLCAGLPLVLLRRPRK